MSDEVFEAAIRLMPYVGDGHFWLSCLHEPTMHPKFPSFIERIPLEYRSNIFYTTNLTRRMPQDYYDLLGRSGLSFINVSIESRDPALYERMRKGSRHRIFMESWEQLLAAHRAGSAPPPLHYITMAYKSNLTEIPDLVAYLREERSASCIDVRYTFDMPHIDPAFKQAEFLDYHDWQWLKAQLAHYPTHEVNLSLPPGLLPPLDVSAISNGAQTDAPLAAAGHPAADSTASEQPQPVRAPGEFEFRVSCDGKVCIAPFYSANRPDAIRDIAETNIVDIYDLGAFLQSLDPG
jgi:hypothetical protein